MSFLSKIFGNKKSANIIDDQMLVEANVCPNCWGKQEYGEQFVKYEYDQTKANVIKSSRKAFVQQFVESHVTGIHLKSEGNSLSCPKCNAKF